MSRVRLLLIAVVLGGCTVAPGGPSSSASPPLDPTGAWQLRAGSVDGAPIPMVDGYPITLQIAGSQLTGIAACNDYGTTLTVRDGRLDLGEIGATAKGCVDEGVMESESAYLRALEAVDGIGMDGEELVLGGPGVTLRFVRLQPPPTAALTGTRWILETVVDGDVATAAAVEPATLLLGEDGQFRGSTGCRDFRGTWIERGDEILATQFETDVADCLPALVDQDSRVVAVIGDGFVPSVDGAVLTLTDRGGLALVYRAGE